MLQEAIYKFKASGPMLLPELIDNYWIGEIKAYEDYAILPYEVHIPQPIDKVIDMFEKICRHEFDGVVNRHIQLVDESIGGSLAVDLEHPFGDRIAVGAAFMSEHRMD